MTVEQFAATIRGENIRYVGFDFGGGVKGEYTITGSTQQTEKKKKKKQEKHKTHKK